MNLHNRAVPKKFSHKKVCIIDHALGLVQLDLNQSMAFLAFNKDGFLACVTQTTNMNKGFQDVHIKRDFDHQSQDIHHII